MKFCNSNNGIGIYCRRPSGHTGLCRGVWLGKSYTWTSPNRDRTQREPMSISSNQHSGWIVSGADLGVAYVSREEAGTAGHAADHIRRTYDTNEDLYVAPSVSVDYYGPSGGDLRLVEPVASTLSNPRSERLG